MGTLVKGHDAGGCRLNGIEQLFPSVIQAGALGLVAFIICHWLPKLAEQFREELRDQRAIFMQQIADKRQEFLAALAKHDELLRAELSRLWEQADRQAGATDRLEEAVQHLASVIESVKPKP